MQCLEKEQRVCNQESRQEQEKRFIRRVKHTSGYQCERGEQRWIRSTGSSGEAKALSTLMDELGEGLKDLKGMGTPQEDQESQLMRPL